MSEPSEDDDDYFDDGWVPTKKDPTTHKEDRKLKKSLEEPPSLERSFTEVDNPSERQRLLRTAYNMGLDSLASVAMGGGAVKERLDALKQLREIINDLEGGINLEGEEAIVKAITWKPSYINTALEGLSYVFGKLNFQIEPVKMKRAVERFFKNADPVSAYRRDKEKAKERKLLEEQLSREDNA